MEKKVLLEPEAEKVCLNSDKPPFIYQLPVEEGRKNLDDLQSSPIFKYPADITSSMFATSKWGTVKLYFIAPVDCSDTRNIILYIHGAGWVFGDFHTHEKLVRELAARTSSLVVFPEYSLAPEAQYPIAIEQCYEVLTKLPLLTQDKFPKINFNKLTVAGDSAGGNMAIAVCLMAKYRKGPLIHKQVLYYPVTNAKFDTASYDEFSEGYYLTRTSMQWFWDQYAPKESERREITASPLRAHPEWLKGLPATIIINGQADVLRDEGEDFGLKLRIAGVDVTALRVQGTIHDFVMLNSLDQSNSCRIAMDASVSWINRKNMIL